MARYLVKASPNRDLYVEWSTVADNITWVGSRADLIADPSLDASDERLARVDATGTSLLYAIGRHGPAGSWEDPGWVVNNLPPESGSKGGWLPRENLAAFAEAVAKNDTTALAGLLQPFDDDDEGQSS